MIMRVRRLTSLDSFSIRWIPGVLMIWLSTTEIPMAPVMKEVNGTCMGITTLVVGRILVLVVHLLVVGIEPRGKVGWEFQLQTHKLRSPSRQENLITKLIRMLSNNKALGGCCIKRHSREISGES